MRHIVAFERCFGSRVGVVAVVRVCMFLVWRSCLIFLDPGGCFAFSDDDVVSFPAYSCLPWSDDGPGGVVLRMFGGREILDIIFPVRMIVPPSFSCVNGVLSVALS